MTPDPTVLATYLERTRWFGGKGRPFEVRGTRVVGTLLGPPIVRLHLVEVAYSDAESDSGEAGTELYQVPLAYYEHPEHRLDHAFVGWWEDPELGWQHAYDALHDREAMALWQRAFATADQGPLRFQRVGDHVLDLDAHSTLFSGEQSNSSVAYGEDALMKVFRKVTPGENPDITVHDRLTRVGSTHVAQLYGWLETDLDGETIHLAMLQQFLRTATDGWDLALASVRSLFADPEVHANESGADFAGEASRLGEALREVHDALHREFPTATSSAADLATAMGGRLDAAAGVVAGLGEHTAGLHRAYDALAALGEIEVQQVHGDLHLGQTLRTSMGWKIVDFEGEPAKPLAERVLPDSRWRDVAGMLRSFDYAPRVVQRSLDLDEGPDSDLVEMRAQEWAERNKNHFLHAYSGGEVTAEQHTLLDAYVADKAVYETVYETRNRPSWVGIPLRAVATIGAS